MSENVNEVESSDEVKVAVDATISAEQEIGALRSVHKFLSDFDRVPGSMTANWSQMLDTIAVVANSLLSKIPKSEQAQESITEN